MKKLIVILLSAFLILSAFTGCQESEEGADFDSNTHDDTISICDPVPYTADDMETFLNDLKNAQTSASDNEYLYISNSVSSPTVSIKIPVLQNDKYELYQVEVNKWSYFYYYAPIEIKVNGVFDKGTVSFHTIVISISKYPMTFEEGYHSSSHSWVFNDNGKAISVSFPKHTVLENANEVSDYFTFENYVISTNNSTETE